MGEKSKIQWCTATLNPVTGCTKISAGCKNCYAERTAERMKAMGQPNYRNGFTVTIHPHMLEIPLRKKIPQLYFVNSMSDLFHIDVPTSFIDSLLAMMRAAQRHSFLILTKRSERMAAYFNHRQEPSDNVWLGVSVEDQRVTSRIVDLRHTRCNNRFLSVEPQIGPIDWASVSAEGIGWAIFGGESGTGARPLDPDWLRAGVDWCRSHGVVPFVKQMGGVWAAQNEARDRKGGNPEEWPLDLQIREFPGPLEKFK